MVYHASASEPLTPVQKQKTVSSNDLAQIVAKGQNSVAANSIGRPARALKSPAATNEEVSPFFQVSPDPRDLVQLSVRNGIVTVRGSVGSQALAQKLVRQYGRMSGVREIRNQLTVRPNPDADLATKIRETFSKDAETHAGIAVTVYHGVVFLSGSVSSEDERERAEELARNLPGVVRVNNGIQAPPQGRYPVRLASGVRVPTRTR